MNQDATHEVLRNLHLHAQPVRVGRPRRPAPEIVRESEADAALPQQLEMLERTRQEALRAGFEQGLKLGEAEAKVHADATVKAAVDEAVKAAVKEAAAPVHARERQLAALAESLAQAQAQFWEAAEDEAAGLCLDVLCRVLGPALASPEGIRAQVAMLLAERRDALSLHLHPQDCALLRESVQEGGAPRLVPDAEVAIGGCMVRSPGGTLDARLETLLAQCRHSLLETRGWHRDPVQGGGDA